LGEIRGDHKNFAAVGGTDGSIGEKRIRLCVHAGRHRVRLGEIERISAELRGGTKKGKRNYEECKNAERGNRVC